MVLSRWAAPLVYDRVAQPFVAQNLFGGEAEAQMASAAAGKDGGMDVAIGITDLSDLDFASLGLPLDLSSLDLSAIDLGSLHFSPADLSSLSLGTFDYTAIGRGEFSWEDLPVNVRYQIFDKVSTQIVRPVAVRALSGVCFVAVFLFGMALARILLRVLRIIDHLPLLGGFNSILGAALGILEGALIVWLLAMLLQALLTLNTQGFWGIDRSALDATFIVQRFLA